MIDLYSELEALIPTALKCSRALRGWNGPQPQVTRGATKGDLLGFPTAQEGPAVSIGCLSWEANFYQHPVADVGVEPELSPPLRRQGLLVSLTTMETHTQFQALGGLGWMHPHRSEY